MYSTQLPISKIGLGCVTFGREIDQRAAFNMMDHAVERGINFFDTAAAYGDGLSESIIGEWLAANPVATESVLVATKILPPFEPKHIIDAIDGSLRRLKSGPIDLLYFHRWDSSVTAASLRVVNDMVCAGKVRCVGGSNFTMAQLKNALEIQKEYGFARFDFVQNNHNIAVRGITDEFRMLCHQQGIRVVSYSPLGAGFLTGKYQRGVQPDSRFGRVPGHTDIYFQEAANQMLFRLQRCASRWGYTTTELALAWALHQPGVDSVLIGGRVPSHIDQAFSALAFDRPDLLEQIELI